MTAQGRPQEEGLQRTDLLNEEPSQVSSQKMRQHIQLLPNKEAFNSLMQKRQVKDPQCGTQNLVEQLQQTKATTQIGPRKSPDRKKSNTPETGEWRNPRDLQREGTHQPYEERQPPWDKYNQPTERIEVQEEIGEALRGNPPPIFKGRKEQASDWLYAFMRWHWINRQNKSMARPLSRVILAISYIEGRDTKGWTEVQKAAAEQQFDSGIPATDERHWMAFLNDFKDTWKNDPPEGSPEERMTCLGMNRTNTINDYIADFNTLLTELGWPKNHPKTVKAFRSGLLSWIPMRINDQNPDLAENNLEEWQEAAKREVNRYQLKKWEAKGTFEKQEFANERLQERQRLQREGRCFKCQE
jgi:hypothetical protein